MPDPSDVHVNILDEDFKPGVADRIEQLLLDRGCSKQWLAAKLGISKQALNYILKHQKRPKFISEIADIFQMSPTWIATGQGPQYPKLIQARGVVINVYALSELQHSLSLNQLAPCSHISSLNDEDANAFAIEIENDPAMNDKFKENSILIFEPKHSAVHQDYVLARIFHNHKFTVVFRRLAISSQGELSLIPENHNSAIISITEEESLEILGVLKEARFRL